VFDHLIAQEQVGSVQHHDLDVVASQQLTQGFLPLGSERIPFFQRGMAPHPNG